MRISDWSSDVCSSDLSFQCYWRERHAPVVARLPGLLRYVQSHVLPQGYRKGPLLFDGISELRFDSRELYRAALKDFRMDKVIEDERSEEHTSELQSLMRISYAVFCLKKKIY